MKHGRVTQDKRKCAVDPASPHLHPGRPVSCYTRLQTRVCFLLHAHATCTCAHADAHVHAHVTCSHAAWTCACASTFSCGCEKNAQHSATPLSGCEDCRRRLPRRASCRDPLAMCHSATSVAASVADSVAASVTASDARASTTCAGAVHTDEQRCERHKSCWRVGHRLRVP